MGKSNDQKNLETLFQFLKKTRSLHVHAYSMFVNWATFDYVKEMEEYTPIQHGSDILGLGFDPFTIGYQGKIGTMPIRIDEDLNDHMFEIRGHDEVYRFEVG